MATNSQGEMDVGNIPIPWILLVIICYTYKVGPLQVVNVPGPRGSQDVEAAGVMWLEVWREKISQKVISRGWLGRLSFTFGHFWFIFAKLWYVD